MAINNSILGLDMQINKPFIKQTKKTIILLIRKINC